MDDDDDEVEGLAGKVSTAGSRSTATAAPAGGTANAAAQAAGGAQVEGVHPEESEGSDDEQLLDLRMVWDSSSSDRQRGAATEPRPAPDTASGPAAALKEQGNAHMHAGRHQAALQCYTAALAAAGVAAKPGRGGAAGADPQFVATLYSNRAHTLLKLRRHQEVGAWRGWVPAWMSAPAIVTYSKEGRAQLLLAAAAAQWCRAARRRRSASAGCHRRAARPQAAPHLAQAPVPAREGQGKGGETTCVTIMWQCMLWSMFCSAHFYTSAPRAPLSRPTTTTTTTTTTTHPPLPPPPGGARHQPGPP